MAFVSVNFPVVGGGTALLFTSGLVATTLFSQALPLAVPLGVLGLGKEVKFKMNVSNAKIIVQVWEVTCWPALCVLDLCTVGQQVDNVVC